jgi:hypothetical protein
MIYYNEYHRYIMEYSIIVFYNTLLLTPIIRMQSEQIDFEGNMVYW